MAQCSRVSGPVCQRTRALRRLVAPWLGLLAACAAEHRGLEPELVPEEHDAATAQDAVAALDTGANASADAGLVATPPPLQMCSVSPITCAHEVADVYGTGPKGGIHIKQVAVSYWSGFTSGTSLYLYGEMAGQPLQLSAALYAPPLEWPSYACPAGEYRREADIGRLHITAYGCSSTSELEDAILRVDRHEGPPPALSGDLIGGSPVRFEGELTITQAGWSLRVPFSIRAACNHSTDL